jgi:hypothetical protein
MGKLIQEGRGERLEPIARMNGWVSPLLGIRFELEKGAELKYTGRTANLSPPI